MPNNAGQLLLNRMRLDLVPGAGPANLIDTGLRQNDRSYGNASNGEPGDNGSSALQIPSRVMVQPMAPTSQWVGITHGEPFVSTNLDGSQTVKVQFSNAGIETLNPNVLFWNPATIVGPVSAENYEPPVE